jgi:uncharacterized protein (TIGR03118 family)
MRSLIRKWRLTLRGYSPDRPLRPYQLALESLEDRCLLASAFLQTNLLSDIPGVARLTDPNLVNPWGLSFTPTGNFYVSDNNAGVSTVYDGAGQPTPPTAPLVITIPLPAGGTGKAAPTGVAVNGTPDFVITASGRSGSSTFIYVTEDGTISGWNRNVDLTHALLKVDNSTQPTPAMGAVYKGVAVGSNATGNFIFAANFRAGTIEVYDKNFAKATLAGSFNDPALPAGFAPFNIQNLSGQLYVTYAKQDAKKHDDVKGPGNGFVDVFDTNGNLIKRLASQGTLNSPWGLALAPAQFGTFSGDLLVGNFGDGQINIFDPNSGTFLGQLQDDAGSPITIDGLWGLLVGNGAGGGDPNTLFFAAGIADEMHGLFGSLRVETANEHFVAQTYLDVLQRPADPVGLGFWTGMLAQGNSRAQVVQGIEGSLEYRSKVVQNLYSTYLKRRVDPAGLNAFTNFLAAGGTVEQVEEMLTASPEYFQSRGGGTNDGFLTALYQDALQRPVDSTGQNVFGQLLNNGGTRAQVATAIFTSDEFRQDLVQSFYQRFLRRAADSGGLNTFVSLLRQGMRDEQVLAAIVGSEEYLGRL